MADFGQSLQVRHGFLCLVYCFSVNLNAISCRNTSPLSSTAISLTKTEYRKIDPNRSWEVKADLHVFLICIGRAEIKHILVGLLTVKM